MVKKLNPLWMQLLAAVVILSIFLVYIFNTRRSSSWFYDKYTAQENYQIGRINFLLYGEEESDVPIKLFANAPTRLFELDSEANGIGLFDENFNKTVNVKRIHGINKGDVDIYVTVSYEYKEPDVRPANSVFYYLFVPITTDPNFVNNFMSGDYSQYLQTLFASADMTTPAKRKAAFEEQNEVNLARIDDLKVVKDEAADICYLLFWPEYDLADWGNPDSYYEFQETMTITVHSDQFYIKEP